MCQVQALEDTMEAKFMLTWSRCPSEWAISRLVLRSIAWSAFSWIHISWDKFYGTKNIPFWGIGKLFSDYLFLNRATNFRRKKVKLLMREN
jgi:hypothetical protein